MFASSVREDETRRTNKFTSNTSHISVGLNVKSVADSFPVISFPVVLCASLIANIFGYKVVQHGKYK